MRTGRWQVVTIVHYFIDDGRTRDEWRLGHVAAWPVSTKTQDGDVAGGREEQSFERRGRRHRPRWMCVRRKWRHRFLSLSSGCAACWLAKAPANPVAWDSDKPIDATISAFFAGRHYYPVRPQSNALRQEYKSPPPKISCWAGTRRMSASQMRRSAVIWRRKVFPCAQQSQSSLAAGAGLAIRVSCYTGQSCSAFVASCH